MKKKLLFIVNDDWSFLHFRLPIALEAIRQGYEVHVATGITDKLAELESHGFTVHPLSLNRSSTNIFIVLKELKQIFSVMKHVKPDLVHLVTIKPVTFGGIAARLAGVHGVVAAVPGLGPVFLSKGGKALLRKIVVVNLYRIALAKRNLKVIFQNPSDLETLRRHTNLSDRKIEIIPGSGVNLTEYKYVPLPGGTPVVVMAARLLAAKGVREFVEAARYLREKGFKARFCLAGSVDPFSTLSVSNADLDKWKEEGVVELLGHRNDMVRILSTAHVVVLPSYYPEGLPKSLIEAAACGRAVITTDMPGCRDAIEPGVTGILIPIRDVAALACAIEDLITDTQRCKRMGLAGRALAERKFDIKKVVDNHLQIYRKLLQAE